jgi:hypothetical protein
MPKAAASRPLPFSTASVRSGQQPPAPSHTPFVSNSQPMSSSRSNQRLSLTPSYQIFHRQQNVSTSQLSSSNVSTSHLSSSTTSLASLPNDALDRICETISAGIIPHGSTHAHASPSSLLLRQPQFHHLSCNFSTRICYLLIFTQLCCRSSVRHCTPSRKRSSHAPGRASLSSSFLPPLAVSSSSSSSSYQLHIYLSPLPPLLPAPAARALICIIICFSRLCLLSRNRHLHHHRYNRPLPLFR